MVVCPTHRLFNLEYHSYIVYIASYPGLYHICDGGLGMRLMVTS